MKIRTPVPDKKSRLEIIPLIDIMFFLLASFMMVSLQMDIVRTLKSGLPTATLANPSKKPDIVNLTVRTLSPQESRVVLALAEQKRREVGRAEIIKLLGASAKAADTISSASTPQESQTMGPRAVKCAVNTRPRAASRCK